MMVRINTSLALHEGVKGPFTRVFSLIEVFHTTQLYISSYYTLLNIALTYIMGGRRDVSFLGMFGEDTKIDGSVCWKFESIDSA